MNQATRSIPPDTHRALVSAADAAGRAIPPLWPLSSSVAVNPFVGQTDRSLSEVAALLERVAGVSVTMPRAWFAARIADGTISDGDLDAALKACTDGGPDGVAALKAVALERDATPESLPTVADLASDVSGIDWPGLIDDRIGAWAAGYFDTGQALWQLTPGSGAYQSWRAFASRDLTPEIAGLSGFAAGVAATPEVASDALAGACGILEVGPDMAATYFHRLLSDLGGWAQLGRQKLWQAELGGRTDAAITDLLAIRLIWERALMGVYGPGIAERWAEVRAAHATPAAPDAAQIAGAVLQEAAERAAQRELAGALAAEEQDAPDGRPALQAAFCIDVRSEVFRRALESTAPDVETIGFAGFFGLTAAHREFASDVEELRLPVLLNPGVTSSSTTPATREADTAARIAARGVRAWGRFKLAAVSSFAFIEATAPVYAGKLVRDAFGLAKPHGPDPHTPRLDDGFGMDARIAAAGTILRAMSLTENFAPLVLIVGHGANVVNNPHASALHCGACGGYSGEVNARLLAGLLNDADVRAGVAAGGIVIPDDTVFLGALHDTTTDDVTLYESDLDIGTPRHEVQKAKDQLAKAGAISRTERALRLPRAGSGAAVPARSRDWSETRPEWALAGCSAFIAAPRSRTRGKALDGRAFLHDYDWRKDEGFGVLELILTAPVVVASWISLQYYGSVVAPEAFGGGNKLLHNVTGGIGVVEGNGGVLRPGLPWQSVHDGGKLMHDPLRLSVCLEAPKEAVTDILERHPGVRALFDNRWLHLFLLDGAGQMAERYAGGLKWETFDGGPTAVKSGIAA